MHKASEHQPSIEKMSRKLQTGVDKESHLEHNERTKEEQKPENRLPKDTAGRRHFGECAIADVKYAGKTKETAVELKNGLPEKIHSHGQLWQRDGKNPQIWHVKDGQNEATIKADVRFKNGELTVKINEANGSEHSFKNDEIINVVSKVEQAKIVDASKSTDKAAFHPQSKNEIFRYVNKSGRQTSFACG